MIRSFDHTEFDVARLLEAKRHTVSVVLPAREVAATIGDIVEQIRSLGPLVDQLLVVDADSRDGTARLASAAGAEVVQEAQLRPEMGPVLGKGDAMWRGLSVATGDVVVFVDADTRDFPAHFVTGLAGPLLCDGSLQLVKARYRRPFRSADGSVSPQGGGRVTELMARPLLSAFFPQAALLAQPLAGEVAGRRTLLESLPFATGYAVETAMVLDALAAVGPDAIAQVDLGERHNDHQDLAALAAMSYAVLGVVTDRLRRAGRLEDEPLGALLDAEGAPVAAQPAVQRPPLAAP